MDTSASHARSASILAEPQPTPCPRIPYLAPELTDTIIDHLWDDHTTLTRTALVARQFLDASQHHIFSSLRLSGVESTRSHGVEAFLALCAESKGRIGRYVREVEVAGDRWYGHAPSVKRTCLGPRHLREIVRLPFLRKLTLTSVVWDREAEDVCASTGASDPVPPHTITAAGLGFGRDAEADQERHTLDTLTLSHFTSFGSVCASLQDIHALLSAFAEIGELHLLRTSMRLDAAPPVSPPLLIHSPVNTGINVSAAIPAQTRVHAISLGPTSRSSLVYASLEQLRVCAQLERLKVELGDWALIQDLALFLHDAAQDVSRLELDVSTCRSAWVDDEPEPFLDAADWFKDLTLPAPSPLTSFLLRLRSDPPANFWSTLTSSLPSLPPTIHCISFIATDLVPNKFNELVKPSQWASLAKSLKRFEMLEKFAVTFAGIDDFRLALPARRVFEEDFGRALKEREKLFAVEGVKAVVKLEFVLDPEGLV